ncbi:MAG TPA: endonuclease/exonuclease/phosphatase family protein [Solirubrobacteraceae bacterium]|nr:endonuclease/exonuclease/phosphatase family protein [Solirubrobacteraceae bacterium]
MPDHAAQCTFALGDMDLRVLTWNVAAVRAYPPPARGVLGAGGDPGAELAAALDGWAWDVALLQEVPPWWPERICAALHCEARWATARRVPLLRMRRAFPGRAAGAVVGGGGAILARSDRIIGEHSLLLGRRPERRLVHGVALACGVWVSNLHASGGPAAADDLRAAVRASTQWARAARLPLILGGDLGAAAEVERLHPAADAEGLRTAAAAAAQHILCGPGIDIRVGTAGPAARPTPFGVGAPPESGPLAVTLVI